MYLTSSLLFAKAPHCNKDTMDPEPKYKSCDWDIILIIPLLWNLFLLIGHINCPSNKYLLCTNETWFWLQLLCGILLYFTLDYFMMCHPLLLTETLNSSVWLLMWLCLLFDRLRSSFILVSLWLQSYHHCCVLLESLIGAEVADMCA